MKWVPTFTIAALLPGWHPWRQGEWKRNFLSPCIELADRSHEQTQDGCFLFVTACHINRAAQPTPLSTLTASKEQFS